METRARKRARLQAAAIEAAKVVPFDVPAAVLKDCIMPYLVADEIAELLKVSRRCRVLGPAEFQRWKMGHCFEVLQEARRGIEWHRMGMGRVFDYMRFPVPPPSEQACMPSEAELIRIWQLKVVPPPVVLVALSPVAQSLFKRLFAIYLKMYTVCFAYDKLVKISVPIVEDYYASLFHRFCERVVPICTEMKCSVAHVMRVVACVIARVWRLYAQQGWETAFAAQPTQYRFYVQRFPVVCSNWSPVFLLHIGWTSLTRGPAEETRRWDQRLEWYRKADDARFYRYFADKFGMQGRWGDLPKASAAF